MDSTRTVIEVNRKKRKLWLWKRDEDESIFKVVAKYPVAVGSYDGPGGLPDYPTPTGFYCVLRRAKDPSWTLPDSAWVAEKDRGKTIPGGDPRNPIVARWIELGNGVGIHGTADKDSIGTAASHGCLRMLKKDVIELYDRVPEGTIVHVDND